MNANTVPSYVLAVIRDQGHPVQLVNAFEKPVEAAHASVVENSITRLKKEYQNLKEDWDIHAVKELSCPDEIKFKDLLEEVAANAI